MNIDWKEVDWLNLVLIFFGLIIFVVFIEKASDFISKDLERQSKIQNFYNLSIKVVTTNSLEEFEDKLKSQDFVENFLNFDKKNNIIGGYFLRENKDKKQTIYPLKNSTSITKDKNGNISFTLEDGTEINGVYNIYSLNIILDKDRKPVLNKTPDMLKKEFGEYLSLNELEYVWVKNKRNGDLFPTLLFFWLIK